MTAHVPLGPPCAYTVYVLRFALPRLFALLGLAALVAACSASSDDGKGNPGPTQDCVPNQTIRCACGLGEGVASCSADGKLSACSCGPDAPGGDGLSDRLVGGDPATEGVCGNATTDPGEGCDDGNTTSGDGCSDQCAPEAESQASETCNPGQKVPIGTEPITLEGTTASFQDSLRAQSKCVSLPATSNGADLVYTLDPQKTGSLRVTLEAASFPAAIYLREDQCSGADALCINATRTTLPASTQAWVQKGRVYYLVVDGLGRDDQGTFKLTAVIQ